LEIAMKNLSIGIAILAALLPTAIYYDLPEMGACLIVGIAFCLAGFANLKNVKR
jgi:hypothetical protein